MTVVTGFLGSGKTTLINRILTSGHGLRLAVVVHEFGEIGIDDTLVAARDGEVVELVNGCQLCGDRRGLPHALARIARDSSGLDGVLIETSGLADPLDAIEVVLGGGFPAELVLDGVVTVIDCRNFDANLAHATVAYQQMVSADLMVLTKADLVDDSVVELLRSRLGTLNRKAGIVAGDPSALPVQVLLGLHSPQTQVGSQAAPRRSGEHRHEVPSLLLTTDAPLDRERFSAWTEALPPQVIRAKGLVRLTGGGPRTYVFQRVGAREDLYSAPPAAGDRLGARGAQVVLFGTGLDRGGLAATLHACSVGRP